MTSYKKPLILILFGLSGFSSLVYETLWIRVLSTSLGGGTLSVSLVVALFFAGLAGGSYLASFFAFRFSQPLRVYGWLEGLIALCGFYVLSPLQQASHLWTSLWILPPTLAMGATFPLMIASLQTIEPSRGRSVALVYGWNTTGALTGALASGFALVPFLGLSHSNSLMVVVNLAILLVCEGVGRKLTAPPPIASNRNSGWFSSPLLMLATFVTGLTAIGCEVLWSKALTLYFGSNLFGVSVTLALFLTGIALGSLSFTLILPRISQPKKLFLSLVALSCVLPWLATDLVMQAPLWSQTSWLLSYPTLLRQSMVALLFFLPVTFVWGLLLPLTVHLMQKENNESSAMAGQAYAFNTWGGIVGSLLTGLYFIPHWGSSTSLLALLGVQTLLLLAWVLHFLRQNQFIKWAPLLLVVVGCYLVSRPPLALTTLVRSAEYIYTHPWADARDLSNYLQNTEGDLRYWAEGRNALISLHYELGNDNELYADRLVLRSNGLAESYFDLSRPEAIPKYEGLLAVLPYVYQGKPQKTFVVGYGGGYTAEVLSSLPIPQVEVVELEAKILTASEFVYLGENPLMERPNLTVRTQEARQRLQQIPDQTLDIVVSQPSHSWMTGVASLFTQDFFELVKKKMTPQGVYAQWLNTYNSDLVALKSVVATFFETFPYGGIYTEPEDQRWILLGSVQPLHLEDENLQVFLNDRFWRERLAHLPTGSIEDFLQLQVITADQARQWSRGVPLNTDDNAFAEVRQSWLFYQREVPTEDTFPLPLLRRAGKGL